MANELKFQVTAKYSSAAVEAIIKNEVGATMSTVTLTNRGDSFFSGSVGTLAAGEYTVTFKADSVIVGAGELFWNGTEEISIEIVDTIRKALLNNMKVLNDQLIIYDDDGVTPVYTYNLFNLAGEPSSIDITEIESA